jgi:hypothetical protein
MVVIQVTKKEKDLVHISVLGEKDNIYTTYKAQSLADLITWKDMLDILAHFSEVSIQYLEN